MHISGFYIDCHKGLFDMRALLRQKKPMCCSLQVHFCTLDVSISSRSYVGTSWGSSYFANAT